MATLSKCLGIHAAPPQVQKLIRQKMKEYQKDGYDSQTAVERSVLDVQKQMEDGLAKVEAQVKQAEQVAELVPMDQQLDTAISTVRSVDFSIQPQLDGVPQGVDRDVLRYVNKLVESTGGMVSTNEALQIAGTVERRYAHLQARAQNPHANVLDEFKRLGLDPYMKVKPEDWSSLSAQEKQWELSKASLLQELSDRKEQIRRSKMSAVALGNMKAELDKLAVDTPWRNPIERYIDLFMGDPSGRGTNFTWANRAGGINHEYMAELSRGIKEFDTWLGTRMTPEQELALAMELKQAGSSNDNAMKSAASHIRKTFDGIRERMNKNGADIPYLEGYYPQAWNSRQVRLFGLSAGEVAKGFKNQADAIATSRQRWTDYMMERVDREHSLYTDADTGLPYNDQQMRSFLEHAYDSISTSGASKGGDGGKGKGSLALRLSAERQLHFKDAQSWVEANREFGTQDLLTSIVSHVERGAKDIALMEMFGPNPQRVHDQLISDVAKQNTGERWFNSKLNFANALFMEVAASRPTAGSGMFADAMAATRQGLVFTRLGSALLSQIGDLPIYHAMAEKMGIGALRSDYELLKSFNPANKGDRQAADIMDVSVTAFQDDVMSRVMDATNGKGISAKLAQFTMKAGGMSWWADRMAHGAKMGLVRGLAVMSESKFADLSPRNKALLKRSGIEAAEWDAEVYRQQNLLMDYNGRDVLSPDAISNTTLREKIWGLVERESTFMALRPDEKTRALIKGTNARGSLEGELTNSMFLFRSFTAAMIQKVYPRLMADVEGGGWSRAKTAGTFLLLSTAAAAMATQLKEVSKGRYPRDMEKPQFWGAAFAQAWNLGVIGDLLYGDVNRFGQSATATIAGPVAGAGEDLLKYTVGNVRELAKGEDTDMAAETVKMVKNYATPNLWYLRPVLDQVMWYPLQEWANPGYLQRMQDRVERENDTKYFLPPTGAVNP